MKKRDIILIASILVVAIAFFLIVELTKEEGAGVVVKVDGVEVAEYSLSKSGTYPLNGGTNILTVKGGVAYMTYSECPDHTCENTGKIKYVGEQIVCLPNKLTVKIVGSSDGSVDFVS